MCPKCGSDHISIEEFDFGICSQTGYHDAGERFRCGACGATGDPSDACPPSDVETFGSFPAENAGALRDCTIAPASREKRGSQHRLSPRVIVGAGSGRHRGVMLSHWRRKAAPIVTEVLAAMAGRPEHEIRAALRDAYPFGLRKHHPYKLWLDEIRVQTGRRRLSGRQRGLQGRPPEPPDARQTELFA